MGKIVIPLLAIATLFALSACTVKSYEGPELPDDQISHIRIRSSGDASITSVTLDGKKYGGIGEIYQVIPGEHKFSLSYRNEQPRICGSNDYYCETDIDYGTCEGTVKTLPGKNYLITVSNKLSSISITVLAKGYMDFSVREEEGYVGGGSCGTDDSIPVLRPLPRY